MHSEPIAALKELIELSDSPFAYQDQLARLTGESVEEEADNKQERDFIQFQVNNADLALQKNDFKRAVDLLKTAQNAFPNNVDIRTKLFDVYQMSNDIDALLNEGIELLQIYKKDNNDEAYKLLSDKLTKLKPNDERLLDLNTFERTNIEIDFDHAEMIEQINELKHPGGLEEMENVELKIEEEDIFLLKGEDSVQVKTDSELKKGLSSHLAELDFYISEGYFDNAEKILDRLQKEFPESKEIASRLVRIKKSKENRSDKTDSIHLAPGKTEPIEITSSIAQESGILQKFEDSKIGFDLDSILMKPEIKPSAVDFPELDSMPFEIEVDKVIAPEPERIIPPPRMPAPPEPKNKASTGAFSAPVQIFSISTIFLPATKDWPAVNLLSRTSIAANCLIVKRTSSAARMCFLKKKNIMKPKKPPLKNWTPSNTGSMNFKSSARRPLKKT